jgi:tetratricopeptide (TPR) repeat protein
MSAPTKRPPLANVQRWQVSAVCLVLAAITFAVFGQTLTHEFINFDDNEYVYENPVVAGGLSLKGLAWVFTHADCYLYHPLTMLSFMADHQFHGLHAGWYHFTNVVLHTASAIVLFLILLQMTGALWRSTFVAAVFAIHPLHVESVAWVSERKDVLSGLFFMLTIGAYVRYARRPSSSARYGLVVLLFAMGLLCKPILVTLPVLLLLLDYWPLQRVESALSLVMEKLPLLALSAAACAMTVLAAQQWIIPSVHVSMPLRIANALVTCKVYLDQMIYPAGLAVFYPFPHDGLPPGEVALAVALLAVLSIVAWRERRKQPWLLMGWLWYLVMLLPVVGVIQVGAFAHADRYTYLAQVGIYMAATWLVAEWGAKWQAGRMIFATLMPAVLAVLMVCAWKQTAYWQNSEVLSAHALACTTDNSTVHLVLGNTFLRKGKVDEAVLQFQQALKISPGYVQVRNNLGNALLQKRRVDEAIVQFQEALKINPNFAEAHSNLGNALDGEGRVDEAITHYQQALRINPGYAEARNNLGYAFYQKGELDEAIAQLQQALQINPAFVEALNNLGNALFRRERVDEAIACYQKALAISPGYTKARTNLERAILQKQTPDKKE